MEKPKVDIPRVGQLASPFSAMSDARLFGRRDAFHVPGILSVSDHWLRPGDFVSFVDKALTKVEPRNSREDLRGVHGIVDPFINISEKLEGWIPAGYLFWVFPLPEFTINLHHVFDINLTVKTPELPKTVFPLAKNTDECQGCYD